MLYIGVMTPLLAETLTGSFMLQFLLAGLLVLQIANLFAGFLRGREAKRRSISFEGVPLEKSEFDRAEAANKAEHDQIMHRMAGAERGIRAEIKADIEKLYIEVNRLREGQSSLNTMTHSQDRKIEQMDCKLDDIKTLLIQR